MVLEPRRYRTLSPAVAGCASRTGAPECVNVVVSESCQFTVSKEVCLRRSGFMEAALRYHWSCHSGHGEAASVRLDELGIDEHALTAVARYLRCNSASIRCLPAADLDALVEFFDLRELRQERADAQKKGVEDEVLRRCGYCRIRYTRKHNCATSCRRVTRTAAGLCSRCGCAFTFCRCDPIQCPHSDGEGL